LVRLLLTGGYRLGNQVVITRLTAGKGVVSLR
jgi:hypothetical protein